MSWTVTTEALVSWVKLGDTGEYGQVLGREFDRATNEFHGFLGGKDLLVLEPLRHEPTAQHYLPGERSQRLPSVHGTQTGSGRHPLELDWSVG